MPADLSRTSPWHPDERGSTRVDQSIDSLVPNPQPAETASTAAQKRPIDKTLHLLALVDPVDDTYRRTATRQLTVQESRHALARSICHGRRGTIAQPYRDGQEDRLASLGLVLNAVILWNTRYLDAAVATLRAAGHQISDEDVA
jgi:TnpA family transposase